MKHYPQLELILLETLLLFAKKIVLKGCFYNVRTGTALGQETFTLSTYFSSLQDIPKNILIATVHTI